MTARMKNPAMVLPDAMTGIQNIYKAMHKGGVPETTLELVHLRASQINGCSPCVDAGVKSARKAGETEDRLLQVVAWRESNLFTDSERAALALAEAATRLADRPEAVTDEIWAEAAHYFDEQQLAAVILMIGITNLFNRLNTTIREPAGATWG
ncbi:AhpD family alkylhydroperoxidase [Kribbella orskensis]|uniref:AhpD family alkylhydroperoxidase n=1 Tax=Kribbella orskensis TaxID=2512216 RepID=A0ABY2BA59_9ACTN|nr:MULTISPECIES: carboxymuconolactone decarboxylase family protein [Kribbella]TCN32852.1 AhpD family alkylhydroperoxidase [Kribbella sp. VKM Ac-2500]TCO13274.1 AhpD family alkylhydroperoxidase [Kribbella orskensis]